MSNECEFAEACRDRDLFQAALDEAAERGAQKALAALGLSDATAGDDIRDLRGLIAGWRDAKRTVIQTFFRAVTVAVLSALVAGAWVKWGGKP